MSLCNRCLRSVALLAPRSSRTTLLHPAHTRYFTQTAINRNEDQADELKRVKERAWYLDPSPPTPSTSTSSSRPADRPRFTTFDPESTRSDTAPDRLIITPLPLQATSSPLLVQLHEHLTMQSDSVDPTTVRFLHPDSSKILQDQAESLLGETGGTGWTWVVVAQVRGRGRGVVNRAEKEIRKWMREQLGRRTRSRTASRAESDTDWAMVHVGDGVCVNLFTADGSERWNLEELWAKA